MKNEFTYTAKDGAQISAYRWDAAKPKAIVLIVHGAVEHAGRYGDFAAALSKNDFTVYAPDLRGHGKTAGSPENVPYFSDGNNGYDLVLEDIHTLFELIRKENKGIPVFLLGHSMGSFLARVYVSRHGEELAGLLLTGTGRDNPLLISIGILLARFQMSIFGRRHRSPFLDSLVFGKQDKPFKSEGRSSFICSDRAVIEAYRADEYCGNISTPEFVFELLSVLRAGFKKKTFKGCPKGLPIFIGSGEFDSLGGKGLKGVKKDFDEYRKAGVKDVEFNIYKGMRHEILNEKGKQSVYDDVIKWINSKLSVYREE